MAAPVRTNFAHLAEHDEQLLRLGLLAERYFPDDPNTCLLKLRQLGELLAQLLAARVGLFVSPEESQYDLLRRLQDANVLPRDVAQLFGEVRRAGNAASHGLAEDHRTALNALKLAGQLGLWFHRTFKEPAYRPGPFIPPAAPKDESDELRAELTRLGTALRDFEARHEESAQRPAETEARLRTAQDEQAFWEEMAAEADQARAALERRLAEQQQVATSAPKGLRAGVAAAANTAAALVQLDEAETRRLIDEQLRRAGWEADSTAITHGKGSRPEKGRNLAIAEWPTATGPADYVLFAGLMPLATVEAKRKHTDVSGALQQAKRYSRGLSLPESCQSPGGPWGEYAVPFAFSANGRPYLRQLATRSGTWFCDLRRPENLSHALDGWYTPEGLMALLKRDDVRAHQQLAEADGFVTVDKRRDRTTPACCVAAHCDASRPPRSGASTPRAKDLMPG